MLQVIKAIYTRNLITQGDCCEVFVTCSEPRTRLTVGSNHHCCTFQGIGVAFPVFPDDALFISCPSCVFVSPVQVTVQTTGSVKPPGAFI